MVQTQNESVERIEANVEQATVDVSRGRDALMSSLNNMGSNAATAFKVGGIVMATLVVYVLV